METVRAGFVALQRIPIMYRSFALFIAVSLGALACSSAAGPSLDPAHTNCNVVCEQAGKCGPSSFDVDSCEKSCDDNGM